MLHLVGDTKEFDAQRASYLARQRSGEIVRIGHGVYCDRADMVDLPGFMKANALRIANFMIPNAVLAYASAYHKAPVEAPPTNDGSSQTRLFVIGSYSRVYRLQHLEIVQTRALENQNYNQYCKVFSDGREGEKGSLRLRCIIDELLFLQNFGRRRYYPERFLSDRAMTVLRKRLEERHGLELPDHLSRIARGCGDLGFELDRALTHLSRPIEEEPELPASITRLTMGWGRRRIAQISFDGMTWRFGHENGWALPLMHATQAKAAGGMPSFVVNMLPEGFLFDSITAHEIRSGRTPSLIEASERYLSNINITSDPARLNELPTDRLFGRLRTHSRDAAFTGRVIGVPKVLGGVPSDLPELMVKKSMPRMSGYQPKLPMYLDDRGSLSPADGRPFTHILKFPGFTRDVAHARGAVEWAAMDMAKAGGLNTAETSMVALPDGTIGVLSERFDIARDDEDMRMLVSEDFCAVLGLHPMAKYHRTAEQVANKLREVSTNFADDSKDFLRQICANLYLENGDFHLKNLSVLKVANPMLDGFRSVRLSPVYDVVCTRPFADYIGGAPEVEAMVFRVNDKDTDISLADLTALGAVMGLEESEVERIARSVAEGIARRAQEISTDPPALIASQAKVREIVATCCDRAIARVQEMFPDLDCLAAVEDEPALRRRCP